MSREEIDVLAAFTAGEPYPKPLRFKLFENGLKKTVNVSEITEIKTLGAGGMSRIEYTCSSPGVAGQITYQLLYYYKTSRWELVRKDQ